MTDSQPCVQTPLHWPRIQTFKEDQRSCVWLAQSEDQNLWVVKLFVFAGWRQRLLSLFRHHPGHNEQVWHARLNRRNIRAIPVEASGWVKSQRWQMTAYQGLDLYNWLRQNSASASWAMRRHLARQLGALIGQLLEAGLFFRDIKLGNVIVHEQEHHLSLIDAGTIRKRWRGGLARGAVRMIRLAEQSAFEALNHGDPDAIPGLTRTDRLCFMRGFCQAWPGCPAQVIKTLGWASAQTRLKPHKTQ